MKKINVGISDFADTNLKQFIENFHILREKRITQDEAITIILEGLINVKT